MLPFIDIHSHHLKIRNQDNDDGFIQIYNASLDISTQSHDLKSLGIHPWNIDSNKDQIATLEAILENDSSIIAIGECGLDYSIDQDKKVQMLYFQQQILLAIKFKFPLIIHCVKAFDDLILLKKKYESLCPWIIHGFNKSPELALSLIKQGFYISLGKVLFHHNAESILNAIPLNRLFFETDDDSELYIEELYTKASEISRIDISVIKEQVFLNYNSIFDECREE